MNHIEQIAGLKRVPVLSRLSDASVAELARTCRWRQCAPGEQIVGYQDNSTDVYFLVAGKARAVIYSAEGKAVIFLDMQPSIMFGEIAAIDRQPRSATIEALEPSMIASLSAEQFERLMVREPGVAIATLHELAGNIRRLSERVFEFSTLAVQNRIQAELLRLAGGAQQQRSEVLLSPAPSLSEIADRISTHREAVSREISRLTSIGLLRRDGGNLRIVEVAKLASLVHEAKGE